MGVGDDFSVPFLVLADKNFTQIQVMSFATRFGHILCEWDIPAQNGNVFLSNVKSSSKMST